MNKRLLSVVWAHWSMVGSLSPQHLQHLLWKREHTSLHWRSSKVNMVGALSLAVWMRGMAIADWRPAGIEKSLWYQKESWCWLKTNNAFFSGYQRITRGQIVPHWRHDAVYHVTRCNLKEKAGGNRPWICWVLPDLFKFILQLNRFRVTAARQRRGSGR